MKLLLAAILLVVPAATRLVTACSCSPPKPVKQSLAVSDVVFHGTVTSVEPLEAADATVTSPEGRLRVTFKVVRVWKGEVGERFVMAGFTPHVGMCFFAYTVGEDYLIYANGGDGTASTTTCSRSTQLPNKKPNGDFAKLGPGKPPRPAAP